MSKQRPFEKGDLAISKTHGIGVTQYIDENCPTILFKNKMVAFWERGFLSIDDEKPDIVCIRKPRKGNTESRAIVAMSGRLYHKSLLSFLKAWIYFCGEKDRDLAIKNYWETRKKGGFNEQNANYLHFVKAKAMLR